MAFTATNEPTAYGAIPSGNDSWFDGKVLGYFVASTVSIAKGDFVKLASSTTGTITKCNSSTDTFLGIAVGALDNSAGTSASDTKVGVLREGIAMVDVLVASGSGTQKATVNFEDILWLSDTEAGIGPAGQSFTGTDNGTAVARALDKINVPSASALFKCRVYINTLVKAEPVESM